MDTPDTATRVAEYSVTETALAALRTELAGKTFDVATKDGMAAARTARFKLVKLRTALEDKRKEIKAPVLKQANLIDSEAKRIAAELLALEEPIDNQILAFERVEAEKKAAAERAEQERRNSILQMISALEKLPATLVGKPVAELAEALKLLVANAPGGWAQEFLPQATLVHGRVVAQIGEMHTAAVKAAEEAARQAEERERLAKEAAELERRRAEQAKAEAKAKAEREAAEAESRRRIEEQERAARLAREEEDRKAREALESEKRKQAEELTRQQAALQAERDRLDAERRAKEEEAHRAKLEAERQAEEQARAEREAKAAEEERQRQERLALEQRQREEQEAREAAEREERLREQEQQDGLDLLTTFATRFGHLPQFSAVSQQITAFLRDWKKAA